MFEHTSKCCRINVKPLVNGVPGCCHTSHDTEGEAREVYNRALSVGAVQRVCPRPRRRRNDCDEYEGDV